VLFKSLELFDCAEKLLKLGNSATEQIKLAENLVWTKVELFSLGNILQPFLCELILLDVSLMQIKTCLKSCNQLIRWILFMIPK